MLFHDARSFFVLSPSLSLCLSFYSFYFAGEKRFSNWNKILFRRGVEITGPERPRTSLPCPRYFLVRATTSNASTHDACTRRSHAWRFVSTSRLVVFLCFGWHRPTSCRFLFPGPRVLRSLPSFSFFSSLFPSLSLSLSLHLCLYRARGYEQEYKTGDIVLARRRFPSRVEFGLISRNSNLLLFFSFFFSTIRVSIFIVGRKFGDYSRVPGCGDSSVHVWIHRRRQSRITGDSLGRAKPTRFERWLLLSNNARCFYFPRFFLFIESQVERGTFVRVSFSFIPGSRWDGWCCCYNVADGGLAVVLW